MAAMFFTAGIGLLLVVLGIINMTGNISSLHSYHRTRVAETDRKPFGRLVGLGTVLCGSSVILFSAFLFLYEKTQKDLYSLLGTGLLLMGLGIGLAISLYAINKYNKGIF